MSDKTATEHWGRCSQLLRLVSMEVGPTDSLAGCASEEYAGVLPCARLSGVVSVLTSDLNQVFDAVPVDSRWVAEDAALQSGVGTRHSVALADVVERVEKLRHPWCVGRAQ